MNAFRTSVAGAYLALCLLLGGASAAGALGNGLLQLLGVVLLLLHVWSRGAPPLAHEGRWLVAIFLAFASIAAAQLIPLPADLWKALPGRDVIARSMALIGVEPGQRHGARRRRQRRRELDEGEEGVRAVLRDDSVQQRRLVDVVGAHDATGVHERAHLLVQLHPAGQLGALVGRAALAGDHGGRPRAVPVPVGSPP